MTNFSRFIRSLTPAVLALVAFVTVVASGGNAMAQSSRTWLPAYDNSQKVYVDPNLADFSLTPGFAGNIEQLASKHNLNVVVIATVRGADITNSDRKRWAPEYLHTTAWQHLERYPGFSEARSVVILFVKDGTTVSTGVRVGSAMHAVGLTRDVLNSTSGPVVPVLRANMPGEPEAAFIGIVNNINGYLDAKTAVQAPSASNTPSASSEGGGLSGFALIAMGLVAAVVIFVIISSISSSGGSSSGRNTTSTRNTSSRSSTTTTGDGRSDGSNRATDIATGAVIGGVLGAELARRGQQPAPKEKKKDSGSGDGGGTTGGDTGGTTGGTTGGSSCGSAGCGGGGCGGGGCGGG